ncbi:TetR/AcrR family transcriptional regulator [Actinomadura alba]|uniref:TetR/AcrR family transcriptional regulator n=1 Tax=Actinomadura alba TaxID=406431 RepID=A0ABR7LY86_9ACTN|nr:TetR/AcrR family transcriptional regulator [Actinomadura alba]MBC6469467.1 TetR/AcrR family transcriptional regulator [Actinomadura alba]
MRTDAAGAAARDVAGTGTGAAALAGLLAEAPRTDDLDTRILDAALEQFGTYGLRRVAMEDVARRARVARTTIYRRFAGKEQLVQAVILRECRSFLATIAEAIEDLSTPEDALVEGFVVGLRNARHHPLLSRVLVSEPEAFLPQLSMNGGAVMLAARDVIAERLRLARPDAREDFTTPAEILVRVALSLLLVPGGGLVLDDDEAVRAFAREHLTRVLRPDAGR